MLQCCPPRRAGVGRVHVADGHEFPIKLQCCPPRRAGVGIPTATAIELLASLQCPPVPLAVRRSFNAARPEGRESGRAHDRSSDPRNERFNAARPEGRESGRCCRRVCPRWWCFNAARPEGRESGAVEAVAQVAGALASMLPAPKGGSRSRLSMRERFEQTTLQCCPPRRAGVGGLLRPAVPALNTQLQCCPPRRAGVGSCQRTSFLVGRVLQCCPPRRAGVGTATSAKVITAAMLQCCPPRRAGVGHTGQSRPMIRREASMLPAPKGGSRSASPRISSHAERLQCCPPRRAGVGRSVSGRCAPTADRFNAARPEGRESVFATFGLGKTFVASMLPAPKGGSRAHRPPSIATSKRASMLPAPKGGSRQQRPVQRATFVRASMLPAPKGGSRPPYRVGRCIDRYRASMLPAPKGGSRRRVTRHSGHRSRRFNAARPEGRESGPRHHRW